MTIHHTRRQSPHGGVLARVAGAHWRVEDLLLRIIDYWFRLLCLGDDTTEEPELCNFFAWCIFDVMSTSGQNTDDISCSGDFCKGAVLSAHCVQHNLLELALLVSI